MTLIETSEKPSGNPGGLYDPQAQCVAIGQPSTMSREAQPSQSAMRTHPGAYSGHQSQNMVRAVRYPAYTYAAHSYAAHPYVRHQGLPRPPPTHQEQSRVQVNQQQYRQQEKCLLQLEQTLQQQLNHPVKVNRISNPDPPSYSQLSAPTNNQAISSLVNNDIESRIEQMKKNNDQEQYNTTDRARGNGKRKAANGKDGKIRNTPARRNRALSDNGQGSASNKESSDRANIGTSHGYQNSGVNVQYSGSESTTTNNSAVDNNTHTFSNSRVNVLCSNSDNPAANVSHSTNGTNSSLISGRSGQYVSSCPTTNPVPHNVTATAYQRNVNSGLNIRQNPFSRVYSQPCAQPISGQNSRPNCETGVNVDNCGSDNINRNQSFHHAVTAQQPANGQFHPSNVVGDQVASSFSPQNIVPALNPSNGISATPNDSQTVSPSNGSTNDSIIGHLVGNKGNQVETRSNVLNPPEWIDDLDDAILIYIAFNIIEPFDIHSKKFYQTTNELYKEMGKPSPFGDRSPISTSLPQIDLTLTPDRPIIKPKPISQMLARNPDLSSKSTVDYVSDQTARHATDASALLDLSDDVPNDNTLTLYSNKGVRNVISSTLVSKEVICLDPDEDEVNVCPSNQKEVNLCPSNQKEVNLCPSNQNEVNVCPNNQNHDTSKKCQENLSTDCIIIPDDPDEVTREPTDEVSTVNSDENLKSIDTTKVFTSDEIICLDLDDSNEQHEVNDCPSNNQGEECNSDKSEDVEAICDEPITALEIKSISTPDVITKPGASLVSQLKRKNESLDNSEEKYKKREAFNENKHGHSHQRELDKDYNTKENNITITHVIKKKQSEFKSGDFESIMNIHNKLPCNTHISNINNLDISTTNVGSATSKQGESNNDLSQNGKNDLGCYVIIHQASFVKPNAFDPVEKKQEEKKILQTKLDPSAVAKSNESYKRSEKVLTPSNVVEIIKQPYFEKLPSKILFEIDMFKEKNCAKHSSSYYLKKFKIRNCSIVLKRLTLETLQLYNVTADEILKYFPKFSLSLISSTGENQEYLLEADDELSKDFSRAKKINDKGDGVNQSQTIKYKTQDEGEKEENQKKGIIPSLIAYIDLWRSKNILADEEKQVFNEEANFCLNSERKTINDSSLDKIVVGPIDKNEKLLNSASKKPIVDKSLNITETSSIYSKNKTDCVTLINSKKRSRSKKKRKHFSKTANFENDAESIHIDPKASSNSHSKLFKSGKRRISYEEKGSFNSSKKERRPSLERNISCDNDKYYSSAKNDKKLSAGKKFGSFDDVGYNTPKHKRTPSVEKNIDFNVEKDYNTSKNESRPSLGRSISWENDKYYSPAKNEKRLSAGKKIGSFVHEGYNTPKHKRTPSIEKKIDFNVEKDYIERRSSSEKKIGSDVDKEYNITKNERRLSYDKKVGSGGVEYKERRRSLEKKNSFDCKKSASSYKNQKRQNLENNVTSHTENIYNSSKKNEKRQSIEKTFNYEVSMLDVPKTLKRTRSLAELCSSSDDNVNSSHSPNEYSITRPIKKRRKSENDKDLSLFCHIDRKCMDKDLAAFSNNENFRNERLILRIKRTHSNNPNENPSDHSYTLVSNLQENNSQKDLLSNNQTNSSFYRQESVLRNTTCNNAQPTKTFVENKSPLGSTNLNGQQEELFHRGEYSKTNDLKTQEENVKQDLIPPSDPRLQVSTYCGLNSELFKEFNESFQATLRAVRPRKNYKIPDIQNCKCYECNKQFDSLKDWSCHLCHKN